jgi:hypothetical protein
MLSYILKIKNQKSGGKSALFEKDSYLSGSEWSHKIALKRRGSHLKMTKDR